MTPACRQTLLRFLTATAAALVVGGNTAPAEARGDALSALARVPLKEMEIVADDALLYMSVAFPELFTARLARKLSSGFTTTLAMRIFMFSLDSERPVSLAVRTVRIRYDLWAERYQIKASDARGVTNVTRTDLGEIIDMAARLAVLPVAPLAIVDPAKIYFIGVRIEVDPTSKEVLDEYTKWITRPGGARPPGGSKSLFGSFVSLFVNPKRDKAADVFAFRSILFRVILPK